MMRDEAIERLQKESKGVTGQREKAMAPAVLAALEDFCRQDEEFAQAVVQGGPFPDCMAAVAKGVGGSISDLDAYKKAVAFYFPGAGIGMTMTIDLCASVRGETPAEDKPAPEGKKGICLDIADFL